MLNAGQMMFVLAAIPAMAMAAGPMLTEWGANVSSDNAWREYPRPQMESLKKAHMSIIEAAGGN